jgi:hypothetical protein
MPALSNPAASVIEEGEPACAVPVHPVSSRVSMRLMLEISSASTGQ